MKVCKKCNIEKLATEFRQVSANKDGLHSWCKECCTAYRKEQYQENKSKEKRQHQEWAANNSLRRRKQNVKATRLWQEQNKEAVAFWKRNNKHKRKAIYEDGTIRNQDWLFLCNRYDNKCLACGSSEKLTMDHIVPLSKGGKHALDNVQPLCQACNSSKHTKIIDYRGRHENIGGG